MSRRGSLKDRFLRSSASAQDLVKSKEPVQLDDISHGQESLDLVKSKEPVQLDDISHGQESLVALSGDSSSSDVEAAASLKGRFFRSSASAQDLVKSKEPVQLDDISHGQESLVALSGDSSSSDVEAAASLKGRFFRSSASAQDLVKSKEPVQLDDISHGQESLVALSGDSSSSDVEAAASLKDRFFRSSASAQDLVKSKEPVQLDDISHGQESLVALSGDSPSSDAEAAASLKGRFLRSSASAQDLLAAKEPAQLDDISHGQESLVALSGDSPSSDAEAAASLKGRFLRSSASAQDLLAAKEPAQLDKVAHAQESLFAASVAGGDSSSSEVEATASLAPEADVRRLSVSKEPAQFDDGLFGKTRLPLAARKYLRDDSNKQSSILFEGTIYSRGSNDRSSGVVRDWATGAEVRTPCPDTSGSRKVSYADLRDAANFAYEEMCEKLDSWYECLYHENRCTLDEEGKCATAENIFKNWKEFEHIEENYGDGQAEAKIVVKDGVVVLAFRGTDDGTDWKKAFWGCDSSLTGDWVYNCDDDPKTRAGVKVHGGFLEYFELLEKSIDAERADLKNECGLDFDFVVGHSLGGAAATLYAEFNEEVLGEDGNGKNGVVTFGAPRTHWAQSKACTINGLRFYHPKDIATSNKGSDEYHHAIKALKVSMGDYTQRLNQNFPGDDT
ncbi:N,N-dimethylaniline monooxygenase [Aureococcus anophagefferens]|nr:N,N-dimethylaniline monooxygenase [Aureococcus anophagefferens]